MSGPSDWNAPGDWSAPGDWNAPAVAPAFGESMPPPPPNAAFTAAPPTNGLAIASMVLGIVWIYWIGSLLALIFGYVALNQIKRTGDQGRGMAIAGIVLGWVAFAGLALIIVLAIAIAGGSGY